MSQATILVVEDDPAVREFLADALSDQGYRVLQARDGAEAIQALDEKPPDTDFSLVLLDMMLPVVDGLGVLNHLATQGAVPPVVAMSASSRQLAAAQSTGAQATIAKPFDLYRLLDVVAHHCAPGR
jgi:two-component system phosphate regulon response regulator PhoB